MKHIAFVLGFLFNSCLFAADCPTDRLKSFTGTFKGVLSAINFKGEQEPLQNMSETHTAKGCQSFEADIRYSNARTGEETRKLNFTGQWDKAKQAFIIVSPLLNGEFRVIREGQFVVSFETKFAGKPAHCEEMIVMTHKAQQAVRSVHCFEGGLDGASLGVRTAFGTRVP